MADDLDPLYAPPRPAPESRPTSGSLSVWLRGLLWLQIVFNTGLGIFLFAAPERAQAMDPLAPAWSFPARAVFSFLLAIVAAGILRKKRVALVAFFALAVISVPLNIARGLSAPKAIAAGLASPILVGLLVRKKLALFR